MRRSRARSASGMIAVDTNVLVRYLIGDDPEQARRARAAIEGQDVLVTTTVLLETAWVLTRGYGQKQAACVDALVAFAGLANVTVENAAMVAQALAWARGGLDIADALHLAQARDCTAFVTFDRALIKGARALRGVAVRGP